MPHPAHVVAEVDAMSDQQLRDSLLELGEKIGPVTASTRGLYRKKLTSLKSTQIKDSRKSRQIPDSVLPLSSNSSNSIVSVSNQDTAQGPNEVNPNLIQGDPLPVVIAAVTAMSNEAIRTALKHFGRDPGPIVASTRGVYEQRLIKLKTPFEDWFSENDDMEWDPINTVEYPAQ